MSKSEQEKKSEKKNTVIKEVPILTSEGLKRKMSKAKKESKKHGSTES